MKGERQCQRSRLWGGTRWAITSVMIAGWCLVLAYHFRDHAIGSRTIFWWLPIITTISLTLLHNVLKLWAQRRSPSFRKGMGSVVSAVVLGGTAVGTAAALAVAAPPLPNLERFATGVGGTVVLATAGAWLITSLVWARIHRAQDATVDGPARRGYLRSAASNPERPRSSPSGQEAGSAPSHRRARWWRTAYPWSWATRSIAPRTVPKSNV